MAMPKLKLIVAIPRLDAAGPDRVVHALLTGLPRDRFSLALLVDSPGGRYFDQLPDDVDVHVLGSGSRYPIVAFARAIDRLKPQLILTTLRMNATAGLARRLQKRRPTLVMRQANAVIANATELRAKAPVRQFLAQAAFGFAYRQADAFIAQSEDMAIELSQRLRPSQKLATIGNPVDVSEIDAMRRMQSLQRPSLPSGQPALVAVGRLTRQKGFDLLIDAFAKVVRMYPEARLTILGEGPERSALEAQSVRLNVDGRVALPGQSDNVLAQVAEADLVISASRYEGFSNALLEAMVLGRTVVATDCPGSTRELVFNGETGILVPPEDAEALATGILSALASPSMRLGDAARAFVARTFCQATICAKYADFLESCLPANPA